MIRWTATTPAAPHDIWALWADPPTWPSWTPTMRDVTPVRYDGPRPGAVAPVGTGPAAGRGLPGVGASYRVRQPKLPASVWTITRWAPGERFSWASSARGMTSVADHRLEALAEGGTRIEATVSWTGPLAPVARLLLGPIARRYVRGDVEQLAAAANPKAQAISVLPVYQPGDPG